MSLFLIPNYAMVTTAAPTAVATTTSIKTMLQVKNFNLMKVVEWGISFDGSAAATPGRVELLTTGTVFATVTASADADIARLESPGESAAASVSGLTLGTSATGYTSAAEGSITATKPLDIQMIAPTNQYYKQFPLGREPRVAIGDALRIRVHFGTSVGCLCYIVVEI